MRRISILALTALLGSSWVAADESHRTPAPVNDARYEFLKALEGAWFGGPDDGSMPEGATEFRVTAGGTAIEEREMIGTPMEMLTIYSMDGKDLVGTHYCVMGNQPRVVAAKRVENNTLTFACNGKPGNSRSHDEEHIHGWSMRLDADGKLHTSAQMLKDGQVTEAPSTVLTRRQATAARCDPRHQATTSRRPGAPPVPPASTSKGEREMQYLCLIYSNENDEPQPGTPAGDAHINAYMRFTEEITKKGVLLGGNALNGVSTATTVRVRNGKAQTTDGPFAETKEQLGGYYLLECKDLDEALEYAAKIPSARIGSIEVRPVMVFG